MVKKRRPSSSGLRWKRLKAARRLASYPSEHEVHANLIRAWKRQLQEDGPNVFAAKDERKQRGQGAREAELYEQIERLKMELGWLRSKVAGSGQ